MENWGSRPRHTRGDVNSCVVTNTVARRLNIHVCDEQPLSCTTPFTPDAPAFGMHAARNAALHALGTALLVRINLMRINFMRTKFDTDLGIRNQLD